MIQSKSPKPKELKPEELRWKCDPALLEIESSGDLEPIEGIIGQERALKALKLGVDLRAPGYNIFIAGLSGTGKATTVKAMLERISDNCPPLFDYAYVNNFKDDDRPILLTFNVGHAKIFKQDMANAVNILKQRIPKSFESDSYLNRKKKIVNHFNEQEQKMMGAFEEKLKKDNFTLGQVKIGEVARPDIIPLIDGKPVPIYQLEEQISGGKISQEIAQEIIKRYNEYQQELQILIKKGLKLSEEFQAKLVELEKSAAEIVIKTVFENINEKYEDAKIHDYLSQVEDHISQNLSIFKGLKQDGETTPGGFLIDYFKEYEVNVILDNSETKNCPVIIETSPSYANLFGVIEKLNDGRGGWYTDFTKIKAGSLLRANGGYIVLNILHLFEEPGVWQTLKRVLTYRKLEIQDPPTLFSISPTILKPEPISIDTKVILLGSQWTYSVLSENEYDFKKMFKVKADFDYEIKRNEKVLVEYARVIKKLIKEEKLLEFDKKAIAYLIEVGSVYAGHQNKLTARFSQIADLAREANFWAIDDGFNLVSSAHVQKAFNNIKERHGMPEEKVSDMIYENMLIIDTDGERVGQINGLAVYAADSYAFGRPTRITATVSLGSGNIINVEREAGMSGKQLNKGVLIISGYFKETFGQQVPLTFNANLVFEQSYGMVEGDSASCAEIFALLSTLSGLPIKQGIAVTGSLNQKGDVQPIGGVKEKIEGFFAVCKTRGLTGKQGVVIPIQNVQELMLNEEIIDEVKKGKFHIYPISRAEEGIEILTGVKSGERSRDGNYPPNTVFALVEEKIKDLYEKARSMKGNNIRQSKKKTSRKKKKGK